MRIKKLIKIVVIIVFLITMFLAIALIMFAKMINPDTFKEQLSKATYAQTGRHLSINGDVGLSVFPWLGVKVGGVSLSNAERFQESDFAKACKIEVQIKLLPLLFGKVEMGKLVFKDLIINLAKKPSGITNWHDLISEEVVVEKGVSHKHLQLSSEVYVSKVDVDNATITFDDQQEKKTMVFRNLHLESQKINLRGIPFLLKAEGLFENNDLNLTATFNLSSKFTLDLQKKIYAAKEVRVNGELTGGVLQDKVPFSVSTDIVSDLNSQNINIDHLAFSLANIKAAGTLQATDIIYAPNVVGSLDIAEFDPKPILHAIGRVKDVNNAASNVWQKAALKFSIQTTSKFVKIPKLEIKLNDSILTGSGSYSHFNDKVVAFDFDLNQLDLDRYWPKQSVQTSARQLPPQNKNIVSKPSQPTVSSKDTLFKVLRSISLNGDMHIGNFNFNNMRFNKVEMEIDGAQGNIKLKPLSFDFYQGKANGDLTLDVRKDVPSIVVNGSLNNVAVKYLFKDVTGTDKLSGTGFLNVKLNTEGEVKDSLLRNLNGVGSLRISNGDFYGVDIGYQVERGRALLEGKPLQVQQNKPPHTTFDQVTSDFKITNGIFGTNNLLLFSKLFKVQGSGTADLVAQTMNMLLQATYFARGGFYVPIRVTGAFVSPSITPDVAVLLGNILKDKGDKVIKIKGIEINGKTIKDLLHL